ncbi:hypothetical protein SDC9_188169 [bioreactor metagenome]|uniref:Uncharacterized protein n=1 Tax=bioreactor metagenome TaxID=1076179 RepID=A0A645HNK6_9ZZZZ
MNHAILAARITGFPVHHAITLPIDFLEHFLITGVVPIGHQVTGGLPPANVAGRDGPGGAGQFTAACQKLLVNRGAENGELLTPLLDAREFLAGHRAGEEEILRLLAQAADHILLRSIIVITRGDRMPINIQPGEELEHPLNLFNVCLPVNSGVGGYLVAQHFGHLDGFHAFLKDTLPFDN